MEPTPENLNWFGKVVWGYVLLAIIVILYQVFVTQETYWWFFSEQYRPIDFIAKFFLFPIAVLLLLYFTGLGPKWFHSSTEDDPFNIKDKLR